MTHDNPKEPEIEVYQEGENIGIDMHAALAKPCGSNKFNLKRAWTESTLGQIGILFLNQIKDAKAAWEQIKTEERNKHISSINTPPESAQKPEEHGL